MLKRRLLVFLLVATLVLAVQPGPSVQGIVMTPEELAALSSIDADETTRAQKSKESGNRVLHAIAAPFKAFGRLFGGKKNNNKSQRVSRKDVQNVESGPTTAAKTEAKIVTNQSANDVTPAPVVIKTSDHTMHLEKGRASLNAGDFNNAIPELNTAASINPKSADAHQLLGITYDRMGLPAWALKSFEAAVDADKNNPEHLNNLGYLLYKTGDYERATKYLKRATKLSPNDARIWNNLGLVQCKREKFDDAFESFTRAVGEFNAHMNVAGQLLAQGHAKVAIKHLEKAQALQPNSAEVLANLVHLYDMTGRHSDAETARRSIIALRTFAEANK